MAGKATIQDVVDEGFSATMFGSPANFITATTGYIAVVLARASVWASQRVTATNYAAATSTSYSFDCLVRAEVSYASQVLWMRRKSFIDSGASIGLDDAQRAALIAQFQKNADDAEADALYWIGEAQRFFGIDPTADLGGTGISSGYIETGRFPQTSPSPINFGTP